MKPILPKSRNEIDLRYYTTGMSTMEAAPRRFTQHSAEPGLAAPILQRNPHHSEQMVIKPSAFRVPSTDKQDASITTLASAKQVQSKEFA